MKASIITIGDEILIGQTVDTNSTFIGRHLTDLGIDVFEIHSIADTEQHILDALKHAHQHSDIVLITGGLGPTKDDITKTTLAKYFDSEMYYVPEILERIEAYFKKRKRVVLEEHKGLAQMPEKCEVLINEKGTAAAMWFDIEGRITISMPGVPYEMKDFMKRVVLPRLSERLDGQKVLNKRIFTAGKGETFIAEKIKAITDTFPENFKIAFLPNLGTVKLRLTARGKDESSLQAELDHYGEQIKQSLADTFVAFGETTIAAELGKLLVEKNASLSTAESCTGGYIAHLITAVSGSSQYYKGSVVSYANEAKENLLGVQEKTLIEHGAVSEATVKKMAQSAVKLLNTDYVIAVSGIAGPGGGSPEKPVGTVWLALASKEKTFTKKYELTSHREINIPLTAHLALNDLRRFILKEDLN